MSELGTFQRRDFLKLVGIGIAGAASGCASRPAEKLIPYLVAPTDILPGVPYWYASTCRECAAGCGILVKSREGRAIKVEGNPAHPVNRGTLCAHGQATLQGLYHPDRLASPMRRNGTTWSKIGWDEALRTVADRVRAANGGGKVALLTGHSTGSFETLARSWAAGVGGTLLVYEPLGHEAVRAANARTFGRAAVPHYDFSRARTVISFGADFLDTFGAPVRQARDFAAFRAKPDAWFVTVEPRMSQTGSNADEWVAVKPGGEMALALAMLHALHTEGLASAGGDLSAWSAEAVQAQTDVAPDVVTRLARRFAQARPSLAVAGGLAAQSDQGAGLVAAVNLLNQAVGAVGDTLRFDQTMNLDAVAPFADVQKLIGAMQGGQVQVLVVHGANPVHTMPGWAGFAAAMDKVPFKVALAEMLDDTAARCDLVMPTLHALESWGDAEASPGVWSIQQPSMQKLPQFDARAAGDVLMDVARGAGAGSFAGSWNDYVRSQWRGRGGESDDAWAAMLKKGGSWSETPSAGGAGASFGGAPVFTAPSFAGNGDLHLVVYPSPNLKDGRGANKPWLQELPDPTTKIAWSSWAELHPETAKRLGVVTGDLVKVETDAGSVTVPVYEYAGIRKDTVAIPIGQGHESYGRYAEKRGINPMALLVRGAAPGDGAVAYLGTKARLAKGPPVAGIGGIPNVAITQRVKEDRGKRIAQVIPVAALLGGAGHEGGGHGAEAGHELPLAQTKPGTATEPRRLAPGETIPPHAVSAYVPEEKGRSPRQIPIHEGSYSNPNHRHRWAMAIDLNSCNGCQACVVACYAENNIPTVGPELIKRGREMSWIRIERYEESVGAKNDVRNIPMLCQHCSDAPCEIVCPVYATYHNAEGLNAQVYNRCVGTRYCSNNCPYKVRAFNWFEYASPQREATFAFPEPLNWQLNPDVTVRSKGVMEKCTFCVQRILEGKGNARDENRPLQDGEIQTACAQSCPAQAIVFGDLLDPNSRVSKLSKDARRYWVLNELNTKPGITYLKKIDRAAEPA